MSAGSLPPATAWPAVRGIKKVSSRFSITGSLFMQHGSRHPGQVNDDDDDLGFRAPQQGSYMAPIPGQVKSGCRDVPLSIW